MTRNNRSILIAGRFTLFVFLFGWASCFAASEQKICLWHLQSGMSEVYLLGSIHAFREDLYPLPDAMLQAFARADRVVFEVDLNSISQYEMSVIVQEHGLYPESESVMQDLAPETQALLMDYLKSRDIALDEVKRMRPWLLSLNLGLRELAALGYLPELGVDQHFLARAAKEGKPVGELETFEEQIELLARDSSGIQDLALRAALTEIGNARQEIEDLVGAWQSGNADQMYAVSIKDMERYPALAVQTERIIHQRNREMAAKVKGFLGDGGVTLVVVGALHMGGEKGILNLLSADFPIEQLSR